MMANSVGIIDAGYRGNIMAKVRNLSDDNAPCPPEIILLPIIKLTYCDSLSSLCFIF
jgi:hypothetical protein